MNNKEKLLNDKYVKLYEEYYSNNKWLELKRKLSAIDSAKNIISLTKNATNWSLLDIGAGDGNVLNELSGLGIFNKMTALEISDSGIEKINKRKISEIVKIEKFNGYQISFADKEFDLGIVIHVLEHVEHERLFLGEIGRVSKRLLIEVPLEHRFNIQKTILNGKKIGHINFYTMETLINLLESSGFKVIKSEVFLPSVEYEQHLSGIFKGKIKNLIRKILLFALPNIAPKLLSYNGYVYCDSPD